MIWRRASFLKWPHSASLWKSPGLISSVRLLFRGGLPLRCFLWGLLANDQGINLAAVLCSPSFRGQFWVQKVTSGLHSDVFRNGGGEQDPSAHALWMKNRGDSSVHNFQKPGGRVFPLCCTLFGNAAVTMDKCSGRSNHSRCMKKALWAILFCPCFFCSSWLLWWGGCSASEHWEAHFSPSLSSQKYVYMLQCQPLEAKRVGYSTAPNMRVKPRVPAFILIAAFWLSVSGVLPARMTGKQGSAEEPALQMKE